MNSDINELFSKYGIKKHTEELENLNKAYINLETKPKNNALSEGKNENLNSDL